MDRLLDAVSAFAALISPEKVQAVASRMRSATPQRAVSFLKELGTASAAVNVVDQLITSWTRTDVTVAELAAMLAAASHAFGKAAERESVELVWTGPTTPFAATRRTEQALLQVINSARNTLFLTSFVAYNVSTIVRSLNSASARGVQVSMILESSKSEGGRIDVDAINTMRMAVPAAQLYAWRDRDDPFSEGSVHAKVAVADGQMCFITSANLTGYAMERNMEAGVLISGGHVPRLLSEHLAALVDTTVVTRV